MSAARQVKARLLLAAIGIIAAVIVLIITNPSQDSQSDNRPPIPPAASLGAVIGGSGASSECVYDNRRHSMPFLPQPQSPTIRRAPLCARLDLP
jgi:hypothetical protein